MRRSVARVIALLLLGGLLGGALLAWRWWLARESLLAGKTREAWLEELRLPDPAVGGGAARALGDLGEPALPVLLEARKDADLRAHRRAVGALVRLGPVAAPPLVALLDRGGARVETALVRLGPDALPALERALGEVTRATAAARLLGAMGERARPAVPALLGLLQDAQAREEARAEAALALAQIRPETGAPAGDDPPIAALTAALSAPSRVRLAAAQALGQIGPPARAALPSLVPLARDSDAETAAAACTALGQIGGPGAVEPLVTRLLAATPGSKSAALALARLGPPARLGVGPLISALKSSKDDGRFARAVLERLGVVVVPDLEAALKESDAAVRRAAAEVLGLMGPRAVSALPALLALLQDSDPATATSAALALVRIDPTKAAPALPILLRLCKEKDDKVGSPAAAVLADLGTDAASCVPDLLATLKSTDDRLVRRAAFVLARVAPTSSEVVAGLRSALAGPAASRPAVAQALGRMGTAAKDALPDLLKAMKDPALRPHAALAVALIDSARLPEVGLALAEDLAKEGTPRTAALATLRSMPRAPAEVVPALRPLLADRSLVRPALQVVRQLEPKALETILPDLVTLLSEPDADLRRQAGWVLRLLGKPALPALRRALSSPNPAVRAAAAWTLGWPPLFAPQDDPAFLLPLLADRNETVRQATAATVGILGVRAEGSVSTMQQLLGSAEVEMRRAAVRALRVAWWEQASHLEPDLVECLLDPNEEVRQGAAETLRTVRGQLPPLVADALKEALHDQSPAVRLSAADTLARCRGATEAELAPVLLSLARGADPPSRRAVLQVLFPLSPQRARELRDDLEADLRAESVEDRTEAGEWLVRLDEGAAAGVVPFLVGILNGWDAQARYQAVQVLERLGPAARLALPALKRRADRDEDGRVRAAARRLAATF
jgi:HEAT repeat protein